MTFVRGKVAVCALFVAVAGGAVTLSGEPVRVKHWEGITRGFLVLRDTSGATVANGGLTQTARGAIVTSRLTFHFKDGSLHDETAVFTQRGQFRLVSDHLIQKGPSFPQPIELTLKGTGDITVKYNDDKGQPKVDTERMNLPPDVANGILLTLLKNIRPDGPPVTVSYVAATPKPRLVKLIVTVAGTARFVAAGVTHLANHFVIKVDVGGVAGLIAPLIGKQPADTHAWIMRGDVPAFVRSDLALFAGGPIWRIEQVMPTLR